MEMLSFMPILGIGIATSILVGQYIGRDKKHIAVRVTYNALRLAIMYTVSLGLLFMVVPRFFLQLFSGNDPTEFERIVAVAVPLMRVLAFFIVCDTFNLIFASAIKGAGDTKFQMWFAVLWAWLFYVPGTCVILVVLKLHVMYAWMWAVLYLGLLGLVFFLRFRSNKWQAIELIEKKL